MTPPDPIRPGSALATDRGLAEALAASLPALEAAAGSGRKAEKAADNARDTWSLLAAYPWQRLNYRIGRWESSITGWKALISFDAWESYRWAAKDETFQVLDPYTGKRAGELYTQVQLRRMSGSPYARPEVIAGPGGTLDFAGDPRTFGVYRPAGGGPDSIRLSWNPWLNNVVLREGIAALRRGEAQQLPPPYQFVDFDLLDKYRVWFVDGPDKPQRKAPWASEANNYRPGGPPRFGKSR